MSLRPSHSVVLFCAFGLALVPRLSPAATPQELQTAFNKAREEARFDDALATAREWLALVQEDSTARPWQVTSVRVRMHAVGTIAGLPWDAQAELASAYRMGGEFQRLNDPRSAQYRQAAELAEKAGEIFSRYMGPSSLDAVWCVHARAAALANLEDFGRAAVLLESVAARREELLGNNHVDVATTWINLSKVYYQLGRYPEAEKALDRAIEVRTRAEGTAPDGYRFEMLNARAVALSDTRQLAEAERFCRRVIDEYGSSRVPGEAFYNLANVFACQGRLAEAEDGYQRALETWKAVPGPDPRVATCLAGLAALRARQGRYTEADSLYRSALEIHEATLGAEHIDTARDLNDIAGLASLQRRDSDADSLYRRAILIIEKKRGFSHPAAVHPLAGLAGVRVRQGRYAEAESLYTLAIGICERTFGPDADDMAEILGPLSGLFEITGRSDLARTAALRAWRIRVRDFENEVSVLPEADAAGYARGVRSAANRCVSLLLRDGARTDSTRVQLADVVLASKGIVSESLFDRRRVWRDEADPALSSLWDRYKGVARERARLNARGPGEDVVAHLADMDSLRRMEEEIEGALVLESSEFRERKVHANVTVGTVAATLPPKTVLVEYFRYEHVDAGSGTAHERYLVVVIGHDGVVSAADLGPSAGIDSLVQLYRAHIARAASGELEGRIRDHEFNRISSRLCGVIWTRVENDLGDAKAVWIAPDGALSLVSMAGLKSKRGDYLIERHAIHYLSAGRDVVRYAVPVQRSGRGLIGFGNPNFDATVPERRMADDKSELVASSVGREDELRSARAACPDLAAMTWAPLPNSAAEVRAVSGAWKKQYGETPTIYLGAQASEERFKAVAGTARAVHVATHGYYIDPECGWRGDPRVSPSRAEANPLLFSGILLAGANLHGRGVDEEGGEDGVLSAYEVAVLDLRSVDTVVLSGCETGLGRVEAGEGVYGLRRAFLVAGAGRVVVSLWQVPDRLTAAMMAPLHEGDGEPTYARIRTIQLHRLRELRERGASDHPVEWAAFLVVGSPE